MTNTEQQTQIRKIEKGMQVNKLNLRLNNAELDNFAWMVGEMKADLRLRDYLKLQINKARGN